MAESADKDEQVAPGGIAVKAGLTADGGAELTGSVSSDIFRLAFGRRHARNLLEARMAISIAEKEARGEPLTEREAFVFEVLEKEYKRRRERSAIMLDRAMEVLPDMKRQMKALPVSGEQHPTSDEWFSRVIRDAEDISDEDVRELYARVLAGELARPGTFSRKTLSVLRDLERDIAKVFETTTNLLLDGYCLPFFLVSQTYIQNSA